MKSTTRRLCLSVFAAAGLASALAGQVLAAQAEPSVTFGASVTNANGTLSTTLSWSTSPAATSCTASGHASWTGSKAPSGTLDLPPITMSGTYALTLSCAWSGDSGAVLTWTAPTQNTDGSALTNLAGFKVYRGASSPATTLDKTINSPTTTSAQYVGLPIGQNCFAVGAFNAQGVESVPTATGCKTTTANVVKQSSVSLTVNPVPKAPTNLQVE